MKIDELNSKKKKLFFNGHCRHRVPYAQHPRCFEREQDIEIKIGYFDIETGGLSANFDIILCYSIKERDKRKILKYCVEKHDFIVGDFDKRLCKQLIEDLQKFDIIVTYNGARFDLPFSRSRCLSHGLKFPEFSTIKHKDVYYMVRNKLRLHKSSLESACAFLNIEGKNHIRGSLWMKAKHGDNIALKYVQDHCDKDVVILEKLHKKLEIFVKNTVRSI